MWDRVGETPDRRRTIQLGKLRIPLEVFPLGESIGISEAVLREPYGDEVLHGDPTLVPVPAGLLHDFGRLGTVADIVEFATRFGPLRLCPHAVPYGWDGCQHLVSRYFRCEVETLELWQLMIHAANALQRAAVDLAQGRALKEEDWWHAEQWINPRGRSSGDSESKADISEAFETFLIICGQDGAERVVEYQRYWLVNRLNEWLVRGEVRPDYGWSHGRLEIGFTGQTWFGMPGISLVGALAVQLAHAIAGTETTAVCTACGKPFFAARRRAASRDRYCQLCGNEAARRAAKVRYNAKQKASRTKV